MKALICLGCVLFASSLRAQQEPERAIDSLDYSVALDSITLSICYMDQPSTSLFNATWAINNLANLPQGQSFLERKPGIAFRQNGSAGVTTLRINGLSGSRVSLQWQGVEANDPQVGAIDVSELVPFLTNLSFPRKTTSSAPGQLNINEWNSAESPFAMVNLSTGEGYTIGIGLPLSSTMTRVFARLDNFQNQHFISNQRVVTGLADAKGADLRQVGFTHSGKIGHSANVRLDHKVYALYTQRTLPTTAFEQQLGADLATLTARYIASAKGNHNNNTYRGGVLFNRSAYTDDFRQLSNAGQTIQVFGQVEGDILKNLTFNSEARFISAQNENYTSSPELGRGNLNLVYRLDRRFTALEASSGITSQTSIGVLPVGYASLSLGEYVGFRPLEIAVRRMVRFPVLDDLYWTSGGNPTTKAERGWEINATLRKYIGVIWEIRGYARQLNDFIVWLPAQPFWQPANAGRVSSAGGSIEAEKVISFKAVNLTFNANMAYTTAYSTLLNGGLPFNPAWTGGGSVQTEYGKWVSELTYNYIGSQTTSFDESLSLPSYGVTNLSIGHTSRHLSLALSASNLLDSYIPNADGFPTPRRRIQLNFSYQL